MRVFDVTFTQVRSKTPIVFNRVVCAKSEISAICAAQFLIKRAVNFNVYDLHRMFMGQSGSNFLREPYWKIDIKIGGSK